jgi:hypothetical protein
MGRYPLDNLGLADGISPIFPGLDLVSQQIGPDSAGDTPQNNAYIDEGQVTGPSRFDQGPQA